MNRFNVTKFINPQVKCQIAYYYAQCCLKNCSFVQDQAVVDQLLAQRMHGREGSLPLPPDPSPPFSEMAAFPPSCWGGMETGYWIPGGKRR
jgi:hypothetical protein